MLKCAEVRILYRDTYQTTLCQMRMSGRIYIIYPPTCALAQRVGVGLCSSILRSAQTEKCARTTEENRMTKTKWNAAEAISRPPYDGEHAGIGWQEAAKRIVALNSASRYSRIDRYVTDHLAHIAPCLVMIPDERVETLKIEVDASGLEYDICQFVERAVTSELDRRKAESSDWKRRLVDHPICGKCLADAACVPLFDPRRVKWVSRCASCA